MPRTNFREIICVLALTCVSLRVEKLELKYNEHIRGLMISAAKTILGVSFISLQCLGHCLTMCTFPSGDTQPSFLYLRHKEIIVVCMSSMDS